MATAGEIAAWVQSVGWPDTTLGTCIGQAFADEHGGRLPMTAELCVWANATGRRRSDGSWVCIPAEGGMSKVQINVNWTDMAAKVRAWVYQHPIPSVGIVALVWVMLGFGKSER